MACRGKIRGHVFERFSSLVADPILKLSRCAHNRSIMPYVYLILLLSFGACSSSSFADEQVRLSEEDLVYRVVLESLPGTASGHRLVLLDSTVLHTWIDAPLSDTWRNLRRYFNLKRSTRRDFLKSNETPRSLRSISALRLLYAIESSTDIEAVMDPTITAAGGDEWTRFYAHYRYSAGLLRLSRVGFSSNGQQAMVVWDLSCGFLCAEGRVVILSKGDSGWRIVDEPLRMIS